MPEETQIIKIRSCSLLDTSGLVWRKQVAGLAREVKAIERSMI